MVRRLNARRNLEEPDERSFSAVERFAPKALL